MTARHRRPSRWQRWRQARVVTTWNRRQLAKIPELGYVDEH